jgi:hypothetical protein
VVTAASSSPTTPDNSFQAINDSIMLLQKLQKKSSSNTKGRGNAPMVQVPRHAANLRPPLLIPQFIQRIALVTLETILISLCGQTNIYLFGSTFT